MHTVITMNAKDTLSLLVPVRELPCKHTFYEAGILRWLNNSSHEPVFLVLTDLCQLPHGSQRLQWEGLYTTITQMHGLRRPVHRDAPVEAHEVQPPSLLQKLFLPRS